MIEIDTLRIALNWREAARRVAICTVIETRGSAPKPVGSHLIVDGDGAFLGSVSGGCVESDVVAEALDVIETGKARILDFGVGEHDLQRIHAPIGLDIGAEGSAEIAISIVAEVISVRRRLRSTAAASAAA